tara:strand:- start:2469 stop:2870 length:402 start_codon:yes stop_codon:yes gene_type:complete
MQYKHNLHKRLQMLRERQHLTCRKLGEILGVGESIVAKWCNGNRVPSRRNLKKICDYFNVEPAWLIYGIDSDAPVLKEGSAVSETLAVDAKLAFEDLTTENQKAVLAFTKVLLSKQKQEKNGEECKGECINGD